MAMGDRRNLSREAVAAAALGLIDREGLEGLSMRKLGAELGVEAMSLYHYVDSKDDLLDLVLDLLFAEIDLPSDLPYDDWEKALRVAMQAFHQVLIDHPAANVLFASRPAQSEASLQVMRWSYDRFIAKGLTPADAVDAFRFVVSFVMGHSSQELAFLARSHEEEVDYGHLSDPELRQFVEQLQTRENRDVFAIGVDLVITGLKARYSLP